MPRHMGADWLPVSEPVGRGKAPVGLSGSGVGG